MSYWGYLLAFVFLSIAFLLLNSLRLRRDRQLKKIPTYVCNNCGEQDCLCSREDEAENPRQEEPDTGGKA
ncbi:MAG: hypothetical protein AB1659_03535 [Thermodesulfobacteriota bacterium]